MHCFNFFNFLLSFLYLEFNLSFHFIDFIKPFNFSNLTQINFPKLIINYLISKLIHLVIYFNYHN